jgi:hypothetical protein
MKRTAIYAACALALALLGGCGAKAPGAAETPKETPNVQTVTFINGVTDADVWILPETEQNRKTTVWGTATAAKVKTGERREAPLCAPGDEGLYMLRMIDTDHFYYSAGGITLEAGWTMEIKGDSLQSLTLEVKDETGALNAAYEVFAARL